MTPEELLVRFHEQVPDRKAFILIPTGRQTGVFGGFSH
jgi:hypothetical protein